jgi:(2Fe-2S) ferredoxin
VCRKGSCNKRGSGQVWQTLETALNHYPDCPVTLEATGCMKECKQGPNVRILPSHACYSQVQAADVPRLLECHLPI